MLPALFSLFSVDCIIVLFMIILAWPPDHTLQLVAWYRLSAHALILPENLVKMSAIRISSITERYSTPSQLVGKAGIGFKEEHTRVICNVYDGNLGKMSLPSYTLHIACVCSSLNPIPAFPTS